MLPFKLKDWTVAHDGVSMKHQASEIELPKLVTKTMEFQHAGMLAPLDADMGLEKLEMTTSIGGMAFGVMAAFGVIGVGGAMLRYNGAYQEEGAGLVAAAELVVRGKHVEIDLGTAKKGEDTLTKFKSTLSYLKWTVNSTELIEVDILNNIYRVGGRDRMAEIRAALLG